VRHDHESLRRIAELAKGRRQAFGGRPIVDVDAAMRESGVV